MKRKNINKDSEKKSLKSFLFFLLKTILISGLLIAAGIFSLNKYFEYKVKYYNHPNVSASLSSGDESISQKIPLQKRLKLFFTQDGLNLSQQVIELKEEISDYEKIKFIIETLLKGPVSDLFHSTIPNILKVSGVFIVNDKAIINIVIENNQNYFKSITEEMLCIYSIVNSIILNCERINNVQILINGKIQNSLGDFIDISSPLTVDYSLIK